MTYCDIRVCVSYESCVDAIERIVNHQWVLVLSCLGSFDRPRPQNGQRLRQKDFWCQIRSQRCENDDNWTINARIAFVDCYHEIRISIKSGYVQVLKCRLIKLFRICGSKQRTPSTNICLSHPYPIAVCDRISKFEFADLSWIWRRWNHYWFVEDANVLI